MAALGPGYAFWDDGEWVTWEEINEQVQYKEWRARYPNADLYFVEVKTITPFKGNNHVTLNLTRNFSKVLIVKINEEFEIRGKLIDRKALPKARGDRLLLDWDAFEQAR